MDADEPTDEVSRSQLAINAIRVVLSDIKPFLITGSILYLFAGVGDMLLWTSPKYESGFLPMWWAYSATAIIAVLGSITALTVIYAYGSSVKERAANN